MIVAPPSLAGAEKLTVARALPATAVTAVGAPGKVRGVTAFDGLLAGPVPAAFVADTVNVYVTPLLSPTIVNGLAVPLTVAPPGLAVTEYPVIVAPPLLAGDVNATVACPFPPTAITLVGAPGTVRGVTAPEALLESPVPAALVAVTLKVYGVPFARFVTVQVRGPPAHVHEAPPGLAAAV